MSNHCETEHPTHCNEAPAPEECNMPEMMLELADEAWAELVKEKIKAQIQLTCGDKLDELAKMVAEANGIKWANKIASKQHCNDFKHRVHSFFAHQCSQK
jgi:hypothetical protein